MMRCSNVCLIEPISKDKFQRQLAAAWGRVWPRVGKGEMADRMGLSDSKTIDRAVTAANLPEAHTIFNSLCADPTALDEVLALYGFRLCSLAPEAANDMATLSGLCETAAVLSEALKDGKRVHPETLDVADKLRPHMPALIAIVREADALRGAA
jgi:hypothetical protein